MSPASGLHKFAVVMAFIAIVMIAKWLVWPSEHTAGDPCAQQVTTSDGSVSVSKCVVEDKRSHTTRWEGYAKAIIGVFRGDERIKAAARDDARAKAKGETFANQVIGKEVEKKLGGNLESDIAASSETLIEQKIAAIERKQHEEHLAKYEEEVRVGAQGKAFDAVELKRRGIEARFSEAVAALRKSSTEIGGLALVRDEDRSILEERQEAVVRELKELLKALDDPDYKNFKASVKNRRGIDREAVRADLAKRTKAFLENCRGQQHVCLMQARQAGAAWFEEVSGHVQTAFREHRYHDAIGLVQDVIAYAIERPEPAKLAATKRVTLLPTFCAEIQGKGYLAVDGSTWKHGVVTDGSTEWSERIRGRGKKYCVWAYNRAGGSNSWQLHCGQYDGSFDQAMAEYQREGEYAPHASIELPERINSNHASYAKAGIMAGCRAARAALRKASNGPVSEDAQISEAPATAKILSASYGAVPRTSGRYCVAGRAAIPLRAMPGRGAPLAYVRAGSCLLSGTGRPVFLFGTWWLEITHDLGVSGWVQASSIRSSAR